MVAIVSTGHDAADARLHRTVAALQRAGCDVHVRALSRVPSAREERAGVSSRVPSAREERAGVSRDLALPTGKLRRGLRALVWPWQARCDVLITIDPDTALSAWASSKVLRRRWVADVHEDYRELLRDRAWVPKPLLAVLRGAVSVLNWIITRADLVLVADEHVPPREAANRFVMRNVPDVTLLPPMPSLDTPSFVPHEGTRDPGGSGSEWPARDERVYRGKRAVTRDELRAVYVGDLRTSRGLRDMVEAIAATVDDATPWRLDLVGRVAAADRDWFDERLARPDARLIRWHGMLPPTQSWQIAGGADVGLCLLADTPAFRDAMPSKVYEYLAMGMPTVATPLPRVRELVEDTGAGVIVDGVPATVEALRRFAADSEHRATLVANARAAGEELRERPSPYDEAARRVAALTRQA